MNKTRTALVQLINSRSSNTGNNGAIMPKQETDIQPIVEPSAAGTLRMMTAQLNSPTPQGQQQFQVDPNAPPPQFQRIQIQQTPGQKPMPQGNMIVTAQKPFPENVDQVSVKSFTIRNCENLEKNRVIFHKYPKFSATGRKSSAWNCTTTITSGWSIATNSVEQN